MSYRVDNDGAFALRNVGAVVYVCTETNNKVRVHWGNGSDQPRDSFAANKLAKNTLDAMKDLGMVDTLHVWAGSREYTYEGFNKLPALSP